MYKANSSSKVLFDLVLRLKGLELTYSCRIMVTHVSGSRMIYQGTDRISRGRLEQGVSLGQSMLEHCPWGTSAISASEHLLEELRTWNKKVLTRLEPCDWFDLGHDIQAWRLGTNGLKYPYTRAGYYLWTPPPCAADVAVEQLRIARTKRKASWHLMVVPRLMTPLWLKPLYKVADIVFNIAPVHSYWSAYRHEPLIIAFCFPFLSFRPYQLRGTPKMFGMARELSKVYKTPAVAGRNLLQQFLLEMERLESMPRSMVWQLLYYNKCTPFPHRLATDGDGKRGSKRGVSRVSVCLARKTQKR